MSTHSDSDAVRQDVSRAYTQAIQRPAAQAKSCCSPSCCAAADTSRTEELGYAPDELASLPSEATGASFGCGNPLAFADVQPGQTVLDLGSGAGLDLLLAARRVGPAGRVIGVDMTDAMIERARESIARAGVSNVEVRKGIIEELPVDSGTVDWVISNCVINLSPQKDRVFAEIHRVLRPGGVMQVSDIVAEELPDWIRARRALYVACVAGAISEAEYVEGVRRAGLEAVEVRDRLVYDASQIKAFLESEELTARTTDQEALAPETLDSIASALEGKVWSAKILARKPQRR